MKVLVTGGAGFVGSHLTDCLLRGGYQVSIIDDLSNGKRVNLSKLAKFYKLDIRSVKIKNLIKKMKPDFVCHLAAQISVPKSLDDPVKDAQVNIIGSLNILETIKDLAIKKFLFVSTGGAIYGQADIIPTPETAASKPVSPYGESKFTIERYLQFYSQHYGLPFVIGRLANVYGPRQDANGECGVVSIFINRLLRGEELPIHGTGRQTRDLVYVVDAAKALVAALEKGRGVYNIGTGKETSIRDLAVRLGKISGTVPKVGYTKARGLGDLEQSVLDINLIKRELGWQPAYDLDRGLTETFDWFNQKNA
ncbi:MAG: NAD-dependent epimerase/dehydratase family protein [Patescibacteria group bacterium]